MTNRPLLNLPPRLASAIAWAALDLNGAPKTGIKRLEIESRLGALLVVANGGPLGFRGPLNPDAEPYPLRKPDGSPDLGRYANGVMEEFADLLAPAPPPVDVCCWWNGEDGPKLLGWYFDAAEDSGGFDRISPEGPYDTQEAAQEAARLIYPGAVFIEDQPPHYPSNWQDFA